MNETALKRTILYDEHAALGAKLVPFAGYEMPVQYPTGILTEHNWTRTNAGLFDVSHMGQAFLVGPDHATTAAAMEKLVPADIASLKPHQIRYSQFLNPEGGILDDLMITRSAYAGYEGWLYLVCNASRKDEDFAHIEKNLAANVKLQPGAEMALIALQGPKAEAALAKLAPAVRDIPFMYYAAVSIDGIQAHVSRSGYTGEDGFEISVFDKDAVRLWQLLLANPHVKPIGLGARDSLRLEAGLCLYGHDIDETTSPVEADLLWSIQKRRRSEGGFIGANRVEKEIASGAKRKRVGIKPEGRAPAREGTVVTDNAGRQIGVITSGGFGPTANGPVAMGYVETVFAVAGTEVHLIVREKPMPAQIISLPFVPHNYKR
ncbi:MAG TPA: glycine cleavage system aminomethyltransferase GcvT [Aestuariivirga sp.]|nr:glycine cleavage system aminomethyltransferase GcvT [Aestuariivirga sp.]